MSDDLRFPMCPENLHEGLHLGPIRYVITPEQTRTFADAVKATSPEYIVGESNLDTLASPTMRLPDYALLIASHFKGGKGGVHAKHWCEFHEPMRVGQSIKVDGTITATFRKRGKFYFTLEYEARDATTEQLLIRQAITSVLLNDKGEMQ